MRDHTGGRSGGIEVQLESHLARAVEDPIERAVGQAADTAAADRPVHDGKPLLLIGRGGIVGCVSDGCVTLWDNLEQLKAAASHAGAYGRRPVPARRQPGESDFWAGLRPMTPDGTPIVGATPFSNL